MDGLIISKKSEDFFNQNLALTNIDKLPLYENEVNIALDILKTSSISLRGSILHLFLWQKNLIKSLGNVTQNRIDKITSEFCTAIVDRFHECLTNLREDLKIKNYIFAIWCEFKLIFTFMESYLG